MKIRLYRRKFKLLHALQDPKAFLLSSRGDFQARSMFIPPFTGQRWLLLYPAPWNFYRRLPDTSVKDRQVALLARIPCTLLRFKRFQTTVDWWSVARSFERIPARALRDPFSSKKGGFPIRWWFLFTNDKERRCPNSLIFKYSLLVLRKWKSRKRREEEDGVEEDPREF